jgi:hypothetical protein
MPPVIDLSGLDLKKDFGHILPAKNLFTPHDSKDLATFLDELESNFSEPDFERDEDDVE